MATLPSPDPDRYSDVHVLRRPRTRADDLTANSSLRYRSKWWENLNAKVGAVLIAMLLTGAWILPRIYKPTYVGIDPIDSKRITFYKRQWFGPTLSYELEARFDQELKTWVWMRKDARGQWSPFFAPAMD